MDEPDNRPAVEEADAPTEDLARANGEREQPPIEPSAEEQAAEVRSAENAVRESLVTLGFVNFDSGAGDNATAGAMVAEERRRHFRRDVYVGIDDQEQGIEFLGRIVEGPFHTPHEISADSALSRVTVLHPDRTRFRPTYYVHGSIEVLGEITNDGRGVVPTATRPRPYSEISIFPADRLREMLGIEGQFYIGHLMGYSGVQVHSNVASKNFLPRNVGVFGTIGSGKSNTTQVLAEEALAAGWAVVVVDVEGEYVRMNEPSDDSRLIALMHEQFHIEPGGVADFRVYVPSRGRSDAERPIPFKIPISEIDPEIISNILEFSEPQARMFDRAVTAARRQGEQRGRAAGGGGRMGVLAGGQAAQPARERPFTLQDLVDGLVDNNGQSPLVGPLQPTEVSTVWTLRAKLMGLGGSQVLDWNATARVPELPIEDLLVGGRLSILDVSETADRSRNIAISYLLNAVFNRVIDTDAGEPMPNGRPRPRVLVVIEEVHTFVSRQAVSKMRAILDQLQIVSRRGRKRWMGLALVSQQPGHVPDELFELANTRFIHQLKSATNIAPVKQTTGGVHEALWSTVPSLGPGQCLLTGAVFRNPLFVTVRPARSRRLLIN